MASRLAAATRLSPVAACALLAACSGDDTKGSSSSLSIAPCADVSTLDCDTMDVPLVHGSTDQRRMLVDVVVLPGTGDGPHEPLLLNPDGPGGAGTELVRELAHELSGRRSLRKPSAASTSPPITTATRASSTAKAAASTTSRRHSCSTARCPPGQAA